MHGTFEIVGILCSPRSLARSFAGFTTVWQLAELLSADVAVIGNKKDAAVLTLRFLASMHGLLPPSHASEEFSEKSRQKSNKMGRIQEEFLILHFF